MNSKKISSRIIAILVALTFVIPQLAGYDNMSVWGDTDKSKEASKATSQPAKTPSKVESIKNPTNKSGASQTTEPRIKSKKTVVRQAKDWTFNTEALTLSLEKISYKENDKEVKVKAREKDSIREFDLSAAKAKDLASFNVELAFDFKNITKEKLLKAGDEFSFEISKDQLSLKDKDEAVPVKTCDKQEYYKDNGSNSTNGSPIGAYEIKDNVITVKLNEKAETLTGEVYGVIKSVATLKQNHSSKGEITLQNHNKYALIFPAKEKIDRETDKDIVQKSRNPYNSGLTKEADMTNSRSKGTGSIFGTIFAAAGNNTVDDFDNLSYVTKNLTKTPPISKGTIKIASNKDGYGVNDSNLSIRFQTQFDLDVNYLGDIYENNVKAITNAPGYVDAMAFAPAGEVWISFLNNLPDDILPQITYVIDLNSSQDKWISVPTELEGVNKPLVDNSGVQLGTYSVATDGKVTFVLNKSLYLSSNTSVGVGFDLLVNSAKLNDSTKTDITWDDEKQTIVGTPHTDGGIIDPIDKKFKVTKTAPTFVDTPYIDYTIRVQAPKDGNLGGVTLKDPVPTDLKLLSGELNKNKLDPIDTYIKAGSFEYKFPEDYNKASATFTLRMGIDNYTKDYSNKEFNNIATLYGKDETTPEAVSDKITTKMNFQLVNKKGTENSQNGTKYDWVVDVNTKFSDTLGSSYLVDRICLDAQTYDFNSIRLYGNDLGAVTHLANGPALDSGMKPLSDVVLDSMNINQITPSYYEYTDQTDSKTYGVLIVPFNNYANKHVKMTYTTTIKKTSEELYEPGDTKVGDLKNDVKFYYNKLTSLGIIGDPPEPDLVSATKTFPDSVPIGNKYPGEYEKDTQMLSWEFKLNYYAANVKDLDIEETLDPSVYDLDTLQVGYRKAIKGNVGAYQSLSEIKDQAGQGYTIDKSSGKMKISIGDISKEELYYLTLKAKVVDKNFLTEQKSKVFTNSAVIKGTVGDNLQINNASGSKALDNSLIKKSVINNYDYKDHTIEWKVVANPDHKPITNMKMKDILPEGNVWDTLVSIEQIKQGGGVDKKSASGSGDSGSVTFNDNTKFTYAKGTKEGNSDTQVFTLDPGTTTTDAYTFIFKTKVTGDYLKQQAPISKTGSGSSSIKSDYSFTCLNKGKLGGEVYGKAILADATSTTSAINNDIIVKRGEYIKKDGLVHWTVDVNKEGIDLTDCKIIEKIASEYIEMVGGTVKIHAATVSPNGTLEKGEDITNGFKLSQVTDKGFEAAIPTNYKNTPLILTFDTQLIKECALKDVKNTISLQHGTDTPIDSKEASGGNSGNFNMEDFIKSSPSPTILLKKISVNSVALPIGGIKFSLIGGIENNGVYSFDNSGKDRVTSDGTGYALYTRLEKDRVFKINEDTGIADGQGYQGGEVRYIKMSSEAKDTPYRVTSQIQVKSGSDSVNTAELITLYPDMSDKYASDISEAAKANNIVSITNTPKSAGEIKFTKLGDNVNPTSGTKPLEGVKFKIHKDDDPNWKLDSTTGKENIETSNDSGIVTFKNVDPGTYTIEEISTTYGYYKTGGQLKAVVSLDTNNNYQTSLQMKGTPKFELSGTTVTDKLVTGDITLKKVDVKTDTQGLAGAKFVLYNNESAATNLSKESGDIVTRATSDASGKVYFKDIPYGNYWAVEETPPQGYEKKTTPIAITTESMTLDHGVKFTYTHEPNITNTRVKGNLTLHKQNNKTLPENLMDRVFHLTPKDNLTKAYLNTGQTYYEATTDSNGDCSFSDIPWGNYEVTEVLKDNTDPYNIEGIKININQSDIKVDYTTSGKTQGTFTHVIESNKNSGVVTNTLLTTNLKINKTVLNNDTNKDTWFDGDKINGVNFTLTGNNFYGEEITPITGTTAKDGTVTLRNIPLDSQESTSTYTLTETRKAGYQTPDSWTFNVVVKNGKAEIEDFTKISSGTSTSSFTYTSNPNTVNITNKPIKGSVKFTKKSTANLAGLNDKPLSGIKFDLYAVKDNQSETKVDEAASDKDGAIRFDNVIYGQKYKLYEVALPQGYKSAGNFVTGKGYCLKTITGDNLLSSETGAAPDSFTYEDTSAIKNILIEENFSFKKMNENKESLKGIDFKVYRRSNSPIADTATGVVINEPENTSTYYPYTPSSKVTSDTSGIFKLDKLPYGDYLLVEEGSIKDDLRDGYKGEAIHISMRDSNKDGKAENTVQENKNFQGTADVTTKAYNITSSDLADAAWAEITKSNNNYEIINKIKYGFVQMNKVTANKNTGGTLSSTQKPLANAVFEIKKDGGTEVFLTLKTNEKGNFEKTIDGIYQGVNGEKKRLFYGKYTIKEKVAPAGFKVDDKTYSFELNKNSTGHEGTAWISTSTDSTVYVKQNEAAPDQTINYFADPIVRGTVTIDKKDEGGTTSLSGAKFIVVDKNASNVSVASLIETSSKGTYKLTDEAIEGYIFTKTDAVTGEDYLYKTNDNFQLVEGQYAIKEVEVPKGYVVPTSYVAQFAIDKNGRTIGTNGTSVEENTGKITVKNTSTNFSLKKMDQLGKPVPNAELKITGNFADNTVEKALRSDAKGVLKLGNSSSIKALLISGEEYTISEPASPQDCYKPLKANVVFKLNADGAIDRVNLAAGSTGVAEKDVFKVGTGNTSLTLIDENLLGSVQLIKHKTGDENTPIEGAEFTLYKVEGKIDPGTGSENNDIKICEKITTNASGNWNSDDVGESIKYTANGEEWKLKDGLLFGDYYFLETKTPDDYYKTSQPVGRFTVNKENTAPNEIIKTKVGNDLFKTTIQISKLDAWNKKGLKGATFTLYKKNNDGWNVVKNDITSGESGEARYEIESKGDYKLEENNKKGYMVTTPANNDRFTCTFTIDDNDNDKVLEVTNGNNKFTNKTPETNSGIFTKDGILNNRQEATLRVDKIVEKSETPKTPATFKLYENNNNAQDKLVGTFKTGMDYTCNQKVESSDYTFTETAGTSGTYGSFKVDKIPWGEYYLVESEAPDGYALDTQKRKVTINKDNLECNFTKENSIENFKNALNITKIDQNGASLNGASFKLEKQEDDEKWTEIWTNTGDTDKNTWKFGGGLTPGATYRLIETKSPDGYVQPVQPVELEMNVNGEFAIKNSPYYAKIDGDKKGVTIKNTATNINFKKEGLTTELCSNPDITGGNGPDNKIPLVGTTFTIHSDAACTNAIQTAQSSADGSVEFSNMPAGATYYIKETTPSLGYKENNTIYQATLDKNGVFSGIQLAGGEMVEDRTIINDLYRADIVIKKVSEEDPDKVLPGSTYGLYKQAEATKKESVKAHKVTKAATDDWVLIAKATTDKEGQLEFKGVLAGTKYEIRELVAPNGSQISKYPIKIDFNVDANGKVVIASFDDGKGTASLDPDTGDIIWLEPSIVLGLAKKDTRDNMIQGGKFQLEDMNGKVIQKWTSTKDIYEIIGDNMNGLIKAGEQYRMREMKAPEGYSIGKPIVFTVDAKVVKPGERFVQSIEMVDQINSFKVNKVSSHDNKNLKDAILCIYKDGTNKIAKTSKGKSLEWKTNGKTYAIDGLATGSYTLHEKTPPQGYDRAKDISFTIDKSGNVIVSGRAVKENLIIMKDKKTAYNNNVSNSNGTGTTGNGRSGDGSAKTDDSTNLIGLMILMLLGAGGVFIFRRKR
ncbi:MAG: SpaA isopeptide-forming pilin-related protein [Anaerovoracaceae bacterium]